jgi:ABC-type antimicrobial peptide transport system permease subunit
VGVGTTIGVALGLGLDRLINAFLFNAGGVDVAVFAAIVPSLLAVTAIAAYVPARRAAQISPTRALRYE